MYYEKIVNAQTGEEIIREYTSEEIAEIEANILKGKKEAEELDAKKALRNAALSKLIDLGLTEEEIAAL
jgi:hypothetical protein